jgi:hypothetical protein
MNSKPKYLDTAFQEYVIWLRTKYLLSKYEIIDNNTLLGYEQELIADLREGYKKYII